jgi:hypothetical protein
MSTTDGTECIEDVRAFYLRRIAELEAQVAQLRAALIATGRNLRCFLADEVSTEFLANIPEEARLVVKRLEHLEATIL